MPPLDPIGTPPIINLATGQVLGLPFPLPGGAKDIVRACDLRGTAPERIFRAHVRGVDDENESNVHESLIELTFGQNPGIREIDIQVGVNGVFRALADLTDITIGGAPAKAFEALDKDQIELLAIVHGAPTVFSIVRSYNVPYGTPAPSVAPLKNITTWDARGQPTFADTNFIIGIFRCDKRVSLIAQPIDVTKSALLAQVNYGPVNGRYFRQSLSNNVALSLYVDATGMRNLQNALIKQVVLVAQAPTIVQDINFLYTNSRHPEYILPLANNEPGGDINGIITGQGTPEDPLVVPVDKPEQFQIFGAPLFNPLFKTPLAFMQGNYTFEPNQLPALLPPDEERLAFGLNKDGTSKLFTVMPQPISKGRPANKPPTGNELIVSTGNTDDNGQPASPTNGQSRVYQVQVRAEGVGNANNIVQKDLYLIIKDPAVL
jgi:hypothetical protein